jgi:hypothetical protein
VRRPITALFYVRYPLDTRVFSESRAISLPSSMVASALSRASKVVYLFGSVYLENLVLSLQGHHVLLKYTRHSRCYRAPSRSEGLARCLRKLLQRAELPAALLPGPETIVLGC